MNLQEFFNRHMVFTHSEFVRYLRSNKGGNARNAEWLLAYHTKQGHLLRIRRGLFAVLPPGADPERFPVDPFLVAAKMTEDAVLAYHTAMEFYGRAYSTTYYFRYQTSKRLRPWSFRSLRFQGVLFPNALRRKDQEMFSVDTNDRMGIDVLITSLERTMVDLLDRPDLGGGWEEIWRSLEMVEIFNLDHVIEYALLLENSSTVAKVGFFLEQHRESLMVEDEHLRILKMHRPKSPHYFDQRSKKGRRFLKEWNIIVPIDLIERSWEEVL